MQNLYPAMVFNHIQFHYSPYLPGWVLSITVFMAAVCKKYENDLKWVELQLLIFFESAEVLSNYSNSSEGFSDTPVGWYH